MASQLFSPITLAGIELRNRIIVAPMCQYSADEGAATDWHLMHLGQYAVSGVGLIITEAVGVDMAGRISPGCLSLCTDAQEASLKRVVDFCQTFGNTTMGIQLSPCGPQGLDGSALARRQANSCLRPKRLGHRGPIGHALCTCWLGNSSGPR